MKIVHYKKIILLKIFLVIGLLLVGCSQSTEKLIQRGNEDFAKYLYEDALEAYQEAQIESPQLPQPYYNAANVFYRQGDYLQALEQLSTALKLSEEDSLKQNSYYNLGNNSYNSQELEHAVDAYRAALLIDSNDLDAKYNLELALQQQEQQEQQQQEQDQEQQEQQQQDQEQQNKGENSQNKNSETSKNNQNTQSEDSNQNNEQEQEQKQGNNNQESESSSEQENGSGESQEKDNSDQNDGQNQENQMNNNPGEGSQENNPQSNGQIPPPGQKMTPEQAKQLLAAIAQSSQTLQEYLGQIFYIQELPPIQDW